MIKKTTLLSFEKSCIFYYLMSIIGLYILSKTTPSVPFFWYCTAAWHSPLTVCISLNSGVCSSHGCHFKGSCSVHDGHVILFIHHSGCLETNQTDLVSQNAVLKCQTVGGALHCLWQNFESLVSPCVSTLGKDELEIG